MEPLRGTRHGFLITGHTHVPMVKRVGRTIVVNPGSLGESYDSGTGPAVSYAVVDLSSNEVEIVRISDPQF